MTDRRHELGDNDTWIAGPLRDLLTDGCKVGVFAVNDVADAANAILGAVLLAVLGRSMAGADASDPRFRQHSVIHNDATLGLVSGGPEGESVTYVQPVNEALVHYGVAVY